MPQFCVEFHDRGTEGVLGWDLDVDAKSASLVGSTRWARERSLEVCQVISAKRLNHDLGVAVILDVRQLLRNAADAI